MNERENNRSYYRIAFCGAFEIANYGDHLFPLIFREAMKARGIDVRLVLFSPFKGVQAFRLNEVVYSLRDMERLHFEQPFDAIVIGGGELIHFSSSPQLLSMESTGQYVNYKIYETWLIPSLFALKYNVKIIWNAPGCSYELPVFYQYFIKALCQNVDYISVRNMSSKSILVRSGLEEANVKLYPDTAFAMKEYIKITGNANSIIGYAGKYIIFHVNRHIEDDDLPSVINTLDYLENKGFRIVLLPLAYTHGDEAILSRLNQLASNRYHMFDRELTMFEIMTVIKGCDMYIGISFHGAVTALVHHRKAIVYDYIGSIKTKDLFEDLGISRYYVSNLSLLKDAVDQALGDYPAIKIHPYVVQLSEHFDRVKNVICSSEHDKHGFSAFLGNFSDGIDALTKEIKQLYWDVNNLSNNNRELELRKLELQSERNALQEEKNRLQEQINEIYNSRTWRYANKLKRFLPVHLNLKRK